MTPRPEFRRSLSVRGRLFWVASRSHTTERGEAMNGWLMWGLILPLLLVVAGIVTIRRRNHRH
jgi:LPXTG-motif cell wall-anchored protein